MAAPTWSAPLPQRVSAFWRTPPSRCPAACASWAARTTWPEQKIVHCTVGNLAQNTREAGITKTALIVVGDFLAARYDRSKLYDPAFTTAFRRGTDA